MDQPQNEIAELKKRLRQLEAENHDLRRINLLYNTIFEDVSVGIGVATVEGRLFSGNKRICKIWGYGESEFFQKKLEDIIHPEELEGVEFMLERMIAGEINAYTREGRYIHKNGATMWLNASVAAVRDSDGRATHIVAVFVDISDRKAMEEANKLDKERLRIITRNSPDYILMLDTKGVIRYVSRTVEELTPDMVLGRQLLDLIPQEYREEVGRCLDLAVNNLESGDFAIAFPVASGKVYHFGVRLAPVEANGKAVSLVLNATDITQARKAELKFQKSEERFRLISENIQDMICLHDIETRFTYISPSVTKSLGYRPKDLLGKPTSLLIHPDDMSSYMVDFIERVTNGATDTCINCRIKHRDGHYIWVETLSIPFFDEDNRVYQVLTSSRDITKRKLAEEAFLQLAYGVSHNFNNILMAVMSNAQAAQELCERMHDQAPPDAMEFLNNVIRAAGSGRDLVKRLSRHATGINHDIGAREVLEVGSLLKEAASLARGTWKQFEQGTHCLEISAEENLTVLGIRGELSEVLLNLVKNAVEASPDSGLISLVACADGNEVKIMVEDRGLGLDPMLRDQIFNPFISSKGRQGMGLGLTMSRAVVESFGGTISAADRPGGGARFVVALPAHTGGERSIRAGAEAPKPGGEKVLLVEDEALVATGIRAILERAGYEVIMAADVNQALESLAAEDPRVVLCDLGLPGGSGWDVMASAIEKKDPPGVIILTGWAGTAIADIPPGMPRPHAILSKPLNRKELVREVERAIKKES